MNQSNDRSAKYLIEKHGDAILKLAAVPPFTSWRAVANEQVAPRRTPDGLLEVQFADHPAPTPVVIEVESRSSADNARQMAEDLALVYLTTGVWPDGILVVLNGPRDPAADDAVTLASAGGTSAAAVRWRTVRVWQLQAEDVFAAGDVGLLPLVPLTQSPLPPEDLLARCRAEIDRLAPPDDRDELLIVTRLIAGFRYNDRALLDILLGGRMLTESPEYIRIRTEGRTEGKAELLHELIRDELHARFGQLPAAVAGDVSAVTDVRRLRGLYAVAQTCPDVAAFSAALRAAPSQQVGDAV